MVELKQLPKLEAANSFRHKLFQCFFETDVILRSDALKTLGQVVDFWTHAWLDRQDKIPASRPPMARCLSSGSTSSSATGNPLHRDSGLKLQFDDVFGFDDDVFSIFASPNGAAAAAAAAAAGGGGGPLQRGGSTVSSLSLTDEAGWTPSATGESAPSPSDPQSPFSDSDVRFSNKGLGTIDMPTADLNWMAKTIVEETWGIEEVKVNLNSYYTWLLRFSVDCPFRDVRTGCKDILSRAEKLGAQLPVCHAGPSVFVPIIDTVGLDYPDHALKSIASSSTLSAKSNSSLDAPSDEEEEGLSLSPPDKLPAGITIPDRKGPKQAGDKQQRAGSRGRPSAGGGSAGRSARRPHISLVTALFQTPPSPSGRVKKSKRRASARRAAPKFLLRPKEPSESMRDLQLQTYARTGRVGNLGKVLFNFPKFARSSRQVTDAFLSSDSADGPLPLTWRIYLGIIAAAEMRCQYYISLLSENFLAVQGPPEWLKGIRFAPPKLQKIAKLNRYLAHMPWSIIPDDIAWLVRVDEMWSVSEVIQAVLVLSFYHGKSAMALAWGILPEADLLGGTVVSAPVAPFVAPPPSLSPGPPSSQTARSDKAASDLGSSFGVLQGKDNSNSCCCLAGPSDAIRGHKGKTPAGSVPPPSLHRITAAASPIDFDAVTLNSDSCRRRGGKDKPLNRRKSFDECGTSDEPAAFDGATSLSSSAPSSNLYALPTAVNGPSFSKDAVLSPSSSTSSIFEAANSGQPAGAPVNMVGEDYSRFILPAVDGQDDLREREVLAIEEFDWDRSATCVIGSYLESYVDVLDEYFKEAMNADMDDDGLSTVEDESDEAPSKPIQSDTASDTSELEPRERSPVAGGGPDPEADAAAAAAAAAATSARSGSTYFKKGGRSVKEAAWYYALRSRNIYDDDIRYTEIKYLLDKGTRAYIKRICFQPDLVTTADWFGMQPTRNEEKCQLGLIACQARFLGEALWGVKSVSEFLC